MFLIGRVSRVIPARNGDGRPCESLTTIHLSVPGDETQVITFERRRVDPSLEGKPVLVQANFHLETNGSIEPTEPVIRLTGQHIRAIPAHFARAEGIL